jgi:hypothetical protein
VGARRVKATKLRRRIGFMASKVIRLEECVANGVEMGVSALFP